MRLLILPLVLFAYFHNHKVLAQRQFSDRCCEDYCFSTDSEKLQTKHFSTKTAYEIVKGADYGKQYTVPYCKPVKFWMLSRHGTRLPTEEVINQLRDLELLRDEIIKNYEVRKTKPVTGPLCTDDLQLLKSWFADRNITRDRQQYLTVQGWNDIKYLAKNYQRIFPEVLTPQYSPDKYYFRHTNTQRTEASFKAFSDGLFGDGFHRSIGLPPVPPNDTFLKPYSACNLWKNMKDRIEDPGTEVYRFKTSPEMNKTISNISTRLGFQYPLEFKQVLLMWNICRFEQAWFLDRPSPWCTAFTLSEIEVIEYYYDLKYHHKSGYANELSANIPCELMQDMLKRLSTNSQPQVSAYFTHSSSIQTFIVALGAYRDSTPLSSDNFRSMTNRKWRTSALDPFAANLAAIRYDCSEDTNDPSPKVIFFLNQTPLQLGWCNVGLCRWTDVMKQYEKYSNANCKELFCQKSSSSVIQGSIVLLSLSLIYKLIL